MSSNDPNSTPLTLDQRLAKAALLLGIAPESARLHSREISAVNATYVWEDARGGGAIIVAADGSVLFANSSVNPDAHEAAFLSGRRTDEAQFKTTE